jgi:5-methylcytosine-specific restriction endonuclease McrA
MMLLPRGVTAWEWEKTRARVIKNAQVCAICGRSLNPDAPPRSAWSTSVDHKVPRAAFLGLDLRTQRHLTLDPSNLQAVHAKCNSKKGKRRQQTVAPRPQSQVW